MSESLNIRAIGLAGRAADRVAEASRGCTADHKACASISHLPPGRAPEADEFQRRTLRGSAGAIGLRERGHVDQLARRVAMAEGRPHGRPGFAEALAVQKAIERLLAGLD